MPCSLAIRRGLRRSELPADARERGGWKGREERREGEEDRWQKKGAPRIEGNAGGTRTARHAEKDGGKEPGDLCLIYEGCGMGRCTAYRGDERKGTRGKVGERGTEATAADGREIEFEIERERARGGRFGYRMGHR